MYDFDTPSPRKGTSCVKWDEMGHKFKNPDALPFWVADSDYFSAPEIVEALKSAAERCVFGYCKAGDEFLNAVQKWFSTRHGWEIEKDWILPTTGVVSELANVIRTFTEPGDSIIIQNPVYNPFASCIKGAGRVVIDNALIGGVESGYRMNFEDLEAKLKGGAKMMILCNPHNPVGRVWTKDEVCRVAALCKQYGTLLVSDEIHWDIMIGGTKQFTAGLAGTPDNVVVLTAPSKTFNVAGLKLSCTVVPNPELMNKLQAFHKEYEIEKPNDLGMIACQAAYEKCAQWCDEQNEYLTKNAEYVYEFCARELPDVKIAKLEGTYLMWLDISASGATSTEVVEAMAKAGAGLNDGAQYGADGFVRLNIACPRAQLEKGLISVRDGYLACCK